MAGSSSCCSLREEGFRMSLDICVELIGAVEILCVVVGSTLVIGAHGPIKAQGSGSACCSAMVHRFLRAEARSKSVETQLLCVETLVTEGRHVRGLTSRPWAAAAMRIAATGRPTMRGI